MAARMARFHLLSRSVTCLRATLLDLSKPRVPAVQTSDLQRRIVPAAPSRFLIRDERGEVQYHYVLIDYLCSPAGGSLRAGSDADEAVWVERNRVGERQTTEGAVPVIDKAFDLRERLASRA